MHSEKKKLTPKTMVALVILAMCAIIAFATPYASRYSYANSGATLVQAVSADASCFPGPITNCGPPYSLSASAELVSPNAGDVIIVALQTVSDSAPASPTLMDSPDNSMFSLATSVSESSPPGTLYIYTATLSSSTDDTVIASFTQESAAPMWLNLLVVEVSGVTTLDTFTSTGSGSCKTCAVSTSSGAPYVAGSFLFGAIGGGIDSTMADTYSAGSGFQLVSGITQATSDSGTVRFGAEYGTPTTSPLSTTTFPASITEAGVSTGWIEAGITLIPSTAFSPSTTTTTTTSVSTTTSYVTSVSTTTLTQSIQPTLTIEARNSMGDPIADQMITVTGPGGPYPISTNSSGDYTFGPGILTTGDTYTASATIQGASLSASVDLLGNSVIVLEPSPSAFSTPQFPLGVITSILAGLFALLMFAAWRRRRTHVVSALTRKGSEYSKSSKLLFPRNHNWWKIIFGPTSTGACCP
jgi:hypothetical protein